MNFALTPRTIPVKDIIQSTEPALKHLDKTAANQVRIQILQTLKNAKLPRSNTSQQEKTAIKALKLDKSIHILSADKGNATVVMSTIEYDHKVTDILSTDTYRCLPKNPTPTIERKITNKLRSLHQSQTINTPLYRHLKPSGSACPRFFGQPKIHKPGVPLRPIVSSRGGPTYNTARHLTKILHPLVGLTPHHITNSIQFVGIIKDLKLRQSDILVSFDVVSLFTNIPTQEACFIAKQRLQADPSITDRTSLNPEQIHELLLTCVSSSCFRRRDKFFQQTTGAAWDLLYPRSWRICSWKNLN